jgi:hypothetical protein
MHHQTHFWIECGGSMNLLAAVHVSYELKKLGNVVVDLEVPAGPVRTHAATPPRRSR